MSSRRARWLFLAALGCAALTGRAAAGAPVGEPSIWAFLPWDEAVGRVVGREADSEGPKSFAVKPDGGVLVLDQVNLRVLDLDPTGRLASTIPLPGSTFDDIEQIDGRLVLALDRLVTRTLLVLDMQGTPLVEVALEGRGIGHAGLITAMLPRPDGVWLEVQHRHSVRVLDRRLMPCERRIVLGRPAANGTILHGALDGRGGVTVSTSRRGTDANGPAVTLTGQVPIRRIVWLDADPTGDVYLVVHEVDFSPVSPYRPLDERYRMIVLDDRLREVRRLESSWVLTEYDQRVEFRVGPGGRLWQMAFTAGGVILGRWDAGTP